MDARRLHAKEGRLEESLRAAEALVTDGDYVTVGKLVALLEGGGLSSSLHLSIKVKSNVCKLLLDVTNDLTLSGGGERVATLGKDLHHVVSKIAASKIDTKYSVGKSVTFVDRYSVGYAITRVKYSTSGTARSVKGKYSLDVYIHSGYVEGFEHDLGHALAVSLGVKGSLGKKNGVLFGSYAKLVVEGVVPDLLHVVPVGNNTVLDGVFKGKNTTLGLSFVTNVSILLVHAHHDSGVFWAAYNGGEDSAGSVVTSKAGFAHTGAVVYNESLDIFVSHG
jgi:hypothetical protein